MDCTGSAFMLASFSILVALSKLLEKSLQMSIVTELTLHRFCQRKGVQLRFSFQKLKISPTPKIVTPVRKPSCATKVVVVVIIKLTL